MDIEKLIAEITDQVYQKVSSDVISGVEQTSGEADLAKYIDHTLLKADATQEQIIKLCEEARKYKFASVCVNSAYAPLVAKQLSASGVKTCCVIGFPLGAASTEAKVQETIDSIKKGADEVDMVINIGAVKSRDWTSVKDDIENVVLAAHGKALVKVIIEACLLTDEEKVKVCAIAKMAGADFVKTSTGFSTGGATAADVKLMRQTVGDDMGVKASGGVKDYETARKMIEAGATRIGTSNGISIVQGTVNEQEETEHACVGCGTCTKKCPSGRVDIVVTEKY